MSKSEVGELVGDEELDKSSLNVGDGVGLEVLTIVLF
jgi:hypothetical protein